MTKIRADKGVLMISGLELDHNVVGQGDWGYSLQEVMYDNVGNICTVAVQKWLERGRLRQEGSTWPL